MNLAPDLLDYEDTVACPDVQMPPALQAPADTQFIKCSGIRCCQNRPQPKRAKCGDDGIIMPPCGQSEKRLETSPGDCIVDL